MRDLKMRIASRRAESGEMFRTGHNSVGMECFDLPPGAVRHSRNVAGICSGVENMTRVAGIEITDRHEVEIDAMLTEHPRRDAGTACQSIEIVALAEILRRWKDRKITAEPNNAAAFLIYRDDCFPVRARSHRVGEI